MNRRTLRMWSPNSLAATTCQPDRGRPRGLSRPRLRPPRAAGSSSIGWSPIASASGGVVTAALISLEVAQVDLVELVADPPELADAHPPRRQVDRDVGPDRLRPGHAPETRIMRISGHLDHPGDGAQGRLDQIGRTLEPDLELKLV